MSNTVADLTVVPGGAQNEMTIARQPHVLMPRTIEDLMVLANGFARSGMFGIRTPESAMTILMTGMELGLAPAQSMRAFSVIDGKPVTDAGAMVALCLAKPSICEHFTLISSTDTEATYETKRRNAPTPVRMSYTIKDAEAANLLNKRNWQTARKNMLRARCASNLARAVYSDVLFGIYTPDEILNSPRMDGSEPEPADYQGPAEPDPEAAARAQQKTLSAELVGYMARLHKAHLAVYRSILQEMYGEANPKKLTMEQLTERVTDFSEGTDWWTRLDLSEPTPESPQTPAPPPPVDEPPFDTNEPARDGEFCDEAPAPPPDSPAPAAKATTESVVRAGQQAQADAKARLDLQLLIGEIERLGYVGLRKTAFAEHMQAAGIESIKHKAATATVLRGLAGVLMANMDPFEVDDSELEALKAKARGLGVTWEGA